MNEQLRSILEQVAAGTLTPEEADRRIADLSHETPGTAEDRPVERIVVRGGALRLTVVGDPSVADAVADGPHRIERAGGDLVIHTNPTTSAYSVEPPRSAFMTWLGQVMNRDDAAVVVRVNPQLPFQALVVGGTLDLSGLKNGVAVGVEAGSARVWDGSGPLLLDIASGSAKVDWTFSGESRVRVDMGSAAVSVQPGSDVRITAEAKLGQATIRSRDQVQKTQPDLTPTAEVGSGSGTLLVKATMGSAQVTLV